MKMNRMIQMVLVGLFTSFSGGVFAAGPGKCVGVLSATLQQSDAKVEFKSSVPHLNHNFEYAFAPVFDEYRIESIDKPAKATGPVKPAKVSRGQAIFVFSSNTGLAKFDIVKTGQQWGRENIGDGISLQIDNPRTIQKLLETEGTIQTTLWGDPIASSSFEQISQRFSLVHNATKTGSFPSKRVGISKKLTEVYELKYAFLVVVRSTNAANPKKGDRAQAIKHLILIPKYNSSPMPDNSVLQASAFDDPDFIIPDPPRKTSKAKDETGRPRIGAAFEEEVGRPRIEDYIDAYKVTAVIPSNDPSLLLLNFIEGLTAYQESELPPSYKDNSPFAIQLNIVRALDTSGRPRIYGQQIVDAPGRPRIAVLLKELAIALSDSESSKFDEGKLAELNSLLPDDQAASLQNFMDSIISTSGTNTLSSAIPGRPRINPWGLDGLEEFQSRETLTDIEKAAEFGRFIKLVNEIVEANY